MTVFLKKRYPQKKMLFVFANTGKEKEQTLLFLKRLDEHFNIGITWVEAVINPIKGKGTGYRIVNFENASRNGQPFEAAIRKYGLPSKLFRHCTRELKETPIHKYAKKVLGKHYNTAIGIRADEQHRIGSKRNTIYPLLEINVTREFINDWWEKQPFNLELKEYEGNCDFCFLKSKRKRMMLLKDGLDVSWWNDMEIRYGNERQPIFDVRNNISIEDLIKMNEIAGLQMTLLDDVEYSCFCTA